MRVRVGMAGSGSVGCTWDMMNRWSVGGEGVW